MKKSFKNITLRLLAIMCMATAAMNVAAQNALVVHPAGKSFLLDDIQKMTFTDGNMLLATTGGNETIALTAVGKITFEDVVGIPALPAATEINLYPNPVVDYIRIDSPVEITSWTLFDLSGKAVKHAVSDLQIPVIDLPAGFYFLKLDTVNGSVTKKIIKR